MSIQRLILFRGYYKSLTNVPEYDIEKDDEIHCHSFGTFLVRRTVIKRLDEAALDFLELINIKDSSYVLYQPH